MFTDMTKAAGIAGSLSAVGAPSLRNILSMNPALTSALVGALVGAGVSGEGLRTRGALVGGAAGFAGGLGGAGLRRGLGRRGMPSKLVDSVLGGSSKLHQHLGGAAGGLVGGALMQPKPTPILMSNKMQEGPMDGLQGALGKAKDGFMAAKPEIERI